MTSIDPPPRAADPFADEPAAPRTRVLCVDDEPNVLEGLRRHVGRVHDLVLANGGEEGLALLERSGPFDAVVSDMSMPGMNGVAFLAHVRERSPATVRILLTAPAELESAVEAANDGGIHQFLVKPSPSRAVLAAIEAGLAEVRQQRQEDQLLEDTLQGAIRLLAEITGRVTPVTFGRASRLRGYVARVAELLALGDAWEFEEAAFLSQIGCLALPLDLVVRAEGTTGVEPYELELLRSHPRIGAQWIAAIPRLERVAAMIEHQDAPWSELAPRSTELGEVVVLGAQMLRLAKEIDRLVLAKGNALTSLERIGSAAGGLHPRLVELLPRLQPAITSRVRRAVRLRDIGPGMMLDQEIRTLGGQLVLTGGQEVTFSMMQRLKNFAKSGGIQEPIHVTLFAGATL